jgi:hypothetical protein
LLLTDGRPGHANLSKGIVLAAQRMATVTVTEVMAQRGRWPGGVVAAWSNSGLSPAGLLRRVYGIDVATLPPAKLVVSAGAETLGANVACARLLAAANIFYGSLRAFDPASFDHPDLVSSFERPATPCVGFETIAGGIGGVVKPSKSAGPHAAAAAPGATCRRAIGRELLCG